jgi:hypothetical protein
MIIGQIQTSPKHSDFYFKVGNRLIDTSFKKYKDLKESMKNNGWIISFPATIEIHNGRKYIVDGQNRYTASKELGIPVVYVVVPSGLKIAQIASSFRAWSGNDYSYSCAAEGNLSFQKLESFRLKHNISANRAVQLLTAKSKIMYDSGGSAADIIKNKNLEYTQDAEDYADSVLMVCNSLPKAIKKNRGANAAIARILLIDDISPSLMIKKIESNQHKATHRATVNEYVQMFENIYNTRNSNPVPIAIKVLESLKIK